jgi:pimeloyl-ACP methyl ester carboxylesterase
MMRATRVALATVTTLAAVAGCGAGAGSSPAPSRPGRQLVRLDRRSRVIAVEQQAHGHTADIDRPLRVEQMAADTTSLLRQLGVQQADVLGFSTGAAVALDRGLKQPDSCTSSCSPRVAKLGFTRRSQIAVWSTLQSGGR